MAYGGSRSSPFNNRDDHCSKLDEEPPEYFSSGTFEANISKKWLNPKFTDAKLEESFRCYNYRQSKGKLRAFVLLGMVGHLISACLEMWQTQDPSVRNRALALRAFNITLCTIMLLSTHAKLLAKWHQTIWFVILGIMGFLSLSYVHLVAETTERTPYMIVLGYVILSVFIFTSSSLRFRNACWAAWIQLFVSFNFSIYHCVLDHVKLAVGVLWYRAPAGFLWENLFGIVISNVLLMSASFYHEIYLRKELWMRLEIQKATQRNMLAQQQKAVSEAQTSFVANVSHELRTPLHGIIGMTNALMQTKQTEEQTQITEILLHSAQSLVNIANDILLFSKIRQNGPSAVFVEKNAEVRLQDCIEDVLDVVSFKSFEKGLTVTSFVHPNVPQVTLGDPARIRQVILNLVSNAIKFTEKGRVCVSAHVVESKEEVGIEVKIKDTGIGIRDEDQAKLFENFFQAVTGSQRQEGTGLGLFISKHLVEAMGGTIRIASSQVGVGSVFAIWLPCSGLSSKPLLQRFEDSLRTKVLLLLDDAWLSNYIQKRLHYFNIMSHKKKQQDLVKQDLDTLAQSLSGYQSVIVANTPNTFAWCNKIVDYCKQRKPECRPYFVLLEEKITSRPETDKGYVTLFPKPFKLNKLFEVITKPGADERRVESKGPDRVVQGNYSTLSVMMAEDNAVNQKVVLNLMKQLGLRTVELVGNGKEALEAYQRRHFDIIFLDWRMPVLDGIEAAKQIRDLELKLQRPKIPIIAVTANGLDNAINTCLQAGMNDFLLKPFSKAQLQQIIDKYCIQWPKSAAKKKKRKKKKILTV